MVVGLLFMSDFNTPHDGGFTPAANESNDEFSGSVKNFCFLFIPFFLMMSLYCRTIDRKYHTSYF